MVGQVISFNATYVAMLVVIDMAVYALVILWCQDVCEKYVKPLIFMYTSRMHALLLGAVALA